MRPLALLLLALAAMPATAAQQLGRLFFTPAERAQLDQARAQKQKPQPKAEEPAAPPAPQVVTYSGLVRRSDGKAVLWLNNRPVDEKEALSSLPVQGRVRKDGSVVVRVPQTGRTIDLKVGQTIELTSGAVAEGKPEAPASAPPKAQAEPERAETQPAARDAPAERPAETPPAREEPQRPR